MYEGSTEYTAHHVQVWAGLKTPEQFLETLSQKINFSRSFYNDTLSFTELSTESAGKWAKQYGNVYQKGALISASLDLYLLKLSNGQYGMKELKHDLSIKYGKDKFFEDAELFDIITEMTFPQVKDFFTTYIAAGKPIPYERFFVLAGVEYLPTETYRDYTIGGIGINSRKEGPATVTIKGMNSFGEKLGYLEGDEIISINGLQTNAGRIDSILGPLYNSLKEGDIINVKIKRTDAAGKTELVTLSAPAVKVEKTRKHVLRFIPNPTASQLKVRNAWLNDHAAAAPAANIADVAEIDGIIKALYDVISGPAGPRDWNRFRSLYHPEAYMAAFNAKSSLSRSIHTKQRTFLYAKFIQ